MALRAERACRKERTSLSKLLLLPRTPSISLGSLRGRIPLSQATTYLATAPKSNASFKAMLAASEDVQEKGALPVPLHLRNVPTPLMEKLGCGKGYRYPHNFPGHIVDQEYLPEELNGKKHYSPSDSGYEKTIKERIKGWEEKKKGKR